MGIHDNLSMNHKLTIHRSFYFQNALVDHIGVYTDTNDGDFSPFCGATGTPVVSANLEHFKADDGRHKQHTGVYSMVSLHPSVE